MKLGSLFSGYGGLDLGVQLALGEMETAWVSDIEPGPCAILGRRFPTAPNLGDITQINWGEVEPVDIITGGSPCQDLSLSGRRAGMRPGTRSGLWESMLTAIATIRPRLVVWENVRGALSANAFSLMESEEGHLGDGSGGPVLRALGRVLGDLAGIGYDAQWCGIRASDVGAPHGRYRVFVVAYPSSQRWGTERVTATGETPSWRTPTVDSGRGGTPMNLLPTPTARDGKDSEIGPAKHRPDDVDTLSRALVDFGHYAPAVQRWERILGRAAPDPTEVSSGSRRKCEVHGDSKEVRSGKVLHRMREANVSQTVREREVGRSRSFPAEEALFTGLCEYKRKSDREPVPSSCQGTSENGLRDMWDSTGSTCTSCGPRSRKQQSVESENTMRELPSTTSLAGRSGQAPGGHSASKTCTCKRVLSPRFCEWMMGLPAGWVTDVGLPRTQQLRALGNGVVPQQAAEAIRFMVNRAHALEAA